MVYGLSQVEANKNLTPEEQLEEKIRLQKLQEESDFEISKELVGKLYLYKWYQGYHILSGVHFIGNF